MSVPYRGMPIDIRQHVDGLCEQLGIKSDYVSLIQIEPRRLTVELYRGRDGRCSGPKHVERHPGAEALPVMETLVFQVTT